MRSTKICFVYNNVLGKYPIMYEYCTQVHNKGYKVFYIGVSQTEEEFILPEGIFVSYIKSQSNISTAKAISAKIKKIEPDIIHVFHFRWCVLLPLLTGKRKKFLLDVQTVHVADKNGQHSKLSFLKNRLTWLENLFYGHTIALTTDIAKMLKPSLRKIPVIPIGANTEKLQPPDKEYRRDQKRKSLNINQSDLVYIYSGTLSPIRRVDDIIRSFGKAELNKNAWLIIAGDDNDNPNSILNLKESAKKLNVFSKVIFTGFIEFNQLVDYYLAADVGLCYIPQTKYFDLQPPTKLFEYMAAGLVVIATSTTADKAVINNNVNGYLCNDNVEDLAATMLEAKAEFDQHSNKLKENALITVKKYSWEYIVKNYLLPCYENILKKQRNGFR